MAVLYRDWIHERTLAAGLIELSDVFSENQMPVDNDNRFCVDAMAGSRVF